MSRKNRLISTDIGCGDACEYRNKITRATAIGVAVSWLFIYGGIAEASQPSAGAVGVVQESPASAAVKDEHARGSGLPELEEVVVTAQRRAEMLSLVSISVQAVTGSELSRQELQDSTALVRIIPELIFRNQGEAGWISMQQRVTGLQYGYGQNVVNENSLVGEYYDAWNVSAELNWRASEDIKLTSISPYRAFVEDFVTDLDASPVEVNLRKGYCPDPLD